MVSLSVTGINAQGNKYPPAEPEVLRLLAPQRGLTAIKVFVFTAGRPCTISVSWGSVRAPFFVGETPL